MFAFPRKSVDFLTLFSVRQKHGAEISLSSDSDQGFSPWTSPAFFRKNAAPKKSSLTRKSHYL
ncbi:MAG: hypothetical protein ACLSFT_11095, partial [Ruminococcus callidus]